MSGLTESLYDIVNFFHREGKINRLTFGLEKLPIFPYLLRWRIGDLIFIGVLFVLYYFTLQIKPFERQFFINDLTILHPFAEHERVLNGALFFYSSWVPISVIGVTGLVITKPKNKIYLTFISLIGVFISVLLTSVVTDILKNFIGRCRPDFLARCIPKDGTPKDVMVFAKDVCTTKNLALLQDGFRTTPSGHSSLSFAGLGYLSLWLGGQLLVANPRLGSWRTAVAAIPAFGAALIALSRTEDYRHHFVDVLIGSTIGMVIATWSYRRYFPNISHEKAYVPYLISAEDEESKRDEFYERLESQQLENEEI